MPFQLPENPLNRRLRHKTPGLYEPDEQYRLGPVGSGRLVPTAHVPQNTLDSPQFSHHGGLGLNSSSTGQTQLQGGSSLANSAGMLVTAPFAIKGLKSGYDTLRDILSPSNSSVIRDLGIKANPDYMNPTQPESLFGLASQKIGDAGKLDFSRQGLNLGEQIKDPRLATIPGTDNKALDLDQGVSQGSNEMNQAAENFNDFSTPALDTAQNVATDTASTTGVEAAQDASLAAENAAMDTGVEVGAEASGDAALTEAAIADPEPFSKAALVAASAIFTLGGLFDWW